MKVFYDDDYVAMAYSIDATQKAGWIADSLLRKPIPGVIIQSPDPAKLEMLTSIHDPEYVEAVRTGRPRKLAESGSFPWDPGTWVAESACSK